MFQFGFVCFLQPPSASAREELETQPEFTFQTFSSWISLLVVSRMDVLDMCGTHHRTFTSCFHTSISILVKNLHQLHECFRLKLEENTQPQEIAMEKYETCELQGKQICVPFVSVFKLWKVMWTNNLSRSWKTSNFSALPAGVVQKKTGP